MSAGEHLGQQFDYRMQHRPFHENTDVTVAGAHEMDHVYPDYYEHPEYYHSFNVPQDPQSNRAHRETLNAVRKVRGNPNAEIDMYRAAPVGVNEIHHGDWVTPSKTYAQIHGESNVDPVEGKNFNILHKKIPAKHMITTGDYVQEFGYDEHAQ